MKLGKVYMNLTEYRKGLEYVTKAQKILIVAMGPKHPFITGELNDLELMANEDPGIYLEKRMEKRAKQAKNNYGSQTNNEKPWEKDRLVKQQMQEESKYFSPLDYTKFWPMWIIVFIVNL